MLLGIWDNIEDLERKINLDELRLILDAARERDYRNQRFLAAIQGIDLDEGVREQNASRFEEVELRAQACLQGKTIDELEFDILGLDVEIEE